MTARVQEGHLTVIHAVAELIAARLAAPEWAAAGR
jgi:hypothetical protein